MKENKYLIFVVNELITKFENSTHKLQRKLRYKRLNYDL